MIDEIQAEQLNHIDNEFNDHIEQYKQNPTVENQQWFYTRIVTLITRTIWSKKSKMFRKFYLTYEDVESIAKCSFFEYIENILNDSGETPFSYTYNLIWWKLYGYVRQMGCKGSHVTLTTQYVDCRNEHNDIDDKYLVDTNNEETLLKRIEMISTINAIKSYLNNRSIFNEQESRIFKKAIKYDFDVEEIKATGEDENVIYRALHTARAKLRRKFLKESNL